MNIALLTVSDTRGIEDDTSGDILFERIIATGARASVFPIQEFWVDIGRHEDLERVRTEFTELFGVGDRL